MHSSFIIIAMLCALSNGIPTGGKFKGELTGLNNNVTHHLTMAAGGRVSLDMWADEDKKFTIKVNVTEYECANVGERGIYAQYKGCAFYYERTMTLTGENTNKQIVWIKEGAIISYCNPPASDYLVNDNSDSSAFFNITKTRVYLVMINVITTSQDFSLNYTLEMKNWYGYLNLIDYPGLIFYGVMMAVYIIYALIWTVLMALSFKDLIYLQFWIAFVIFLGMLEKAFFVSMYSTVNQYGDHDSLCCGCGLSVVLTRLILASYVILFPGAICMLVAIFIIKNRNPQSNVVSTGTKERQTVYAYVIVTAAVENRPLYIVAELISSAKKSLARMLLIIVSLGYGTVKPSLGPHMSKVFGAGGIYGVFSFLDGITRSYSLTDDTTTSTEYFTMIPLVIIDSIILYWVFTNIMETRHILRLRRNIVKLQFYNHLIYMLIFTILVAVVFMLWSIIYLRSDCLKDWKEIWFDDAFWHLLFSFLLGVIMVLWRPNTNSARFAYAVVDDEEDDYEPVQGANENFETVKMRKVDKEPRVMPNAQLEDDLKWVEENLPSSAVDTILPLIADSDEEMMTTKFEQSKMD